MWNRVCPNQWTNIISKNGRKSCFSYEAKASIHLYQWGEWIYGAQSLKEKRLICKSEFYPIEKQTLNLNMAK